MKLTDMEKFAIFYLSNQMEATSRMIGDHLIKCYIKMQWKCGSHPVMIGAKIMHQLSCHDYVTTVPELRAWRLTKKGRDYIQAERNKL